MAGNVIDIIIKANDQTGTTLNKVNSAFKSLTGFSLSAAGGVAAAGVAFQKLYQFVKSSVDETEKYVTSITDMSRVLGMSTEETSRLVQASDDLFISQEKLQTAMLAASRQGIDVSINGLKSLSDQYLKLNPGVERAQFLMRTFGRSGADMGKLMEVGADGIDAATAAIADNLIVTAQSKINIENYKRSVDNLQDSWQGVKYTVGMEVIPQLDLLMRVLTKGKDDVEIHAQAVNLLEEKISRLAMAASMGNKSAKAAIAELQAELDELNKTAPGVSDAIGVMAGDVSEVTQYFKDLTAEMIFNKIASSMDADAQMELAYQMGLINEKTYSTLTAIDELTAKYDTNKDGVISLSEKTGQYDQQLAALIDKQNQLTDKTVTYTIYTNTITNGGAQSGGSQQGIPFNNQMEAQASGGPVFGNTPYLVGEKGPEVFVPNGSGSIVPNNALGGGSATISQSDMMYLGKIIASEIQKAIG